ncbi:hypothetical protein SteCoe_28858 [Stentor coeruleus]|uniref:Acyltransferase 3 domain-containing protein n=1 Tax=Stentor coeruleus TaxID=5963 RepID=A0A1R2B758_9CILI|nr:hypothetical protein SteCoe_28858 [Stentor coeruleus]
MSPLLLLAFILIAHSSKCSESLYRTFNDTLVSVLSKDLSSVDLSILSYSGKGLNELGHYETCIRDPSLTFYTIHVPTSWFQTHIGICLPNTCKADDVQNFFNENLPDSHLQVGSINSIPYPPSAYFILLMLILLFILGFLGIYLPSRPQKGFLTNFLYCFSLKANYKALMQKRVAKDNDYSSVLDGIRVICMVQVINIHCFSFKTHMAVYNFYEMVDIFGTFWGKFVYSGSYCVDAFFWMGGFLLGFLLLQEVEKKRGKFGTLGWILVFVHRILRILPVYAFFLILYNNILPSMNTGTMWYNTDIIIKDCDEYWWTVLVFMNNFIPSGYGNQCLGVGWYLANDFQFFVLGTLLTVMYYRTARWFSWSLQLIMYIAGIIISYSIAQAYDYSSFPPSSKNFSGGDRDFYHIHYTKPYTRFFPYVLGLFCGFIFLRYYKQYISKETDTHSDHIASYIILYSKHPKFSYIIFIFGIGLAYFLIAIQFELYENTNIPDLWTPWQHYIFLSTQRLLYGLALSCTVLPLLCGKIRFVSSILSHKVFSPLAKLTFSCFLVQFGLIFGVTASQNVGMQYYALTQFRDALVCVVLSYALSLPVYLLVEAPFANLEKLLCSAFTGNKNR